MIFHAPRYPAHHAVFLVSYAFTRFGLLGNWLLPSDAWPVPMMPLGPLLAALAVLAFTEG